MPANTANCLFRATVKVRPDPENKPNTKLIGAYVDCFIAAADHLTGLRFAVEELSRKGWLFDDLRDGNVHQLDPQNWDEFIKSASPELPNYFPRQDDILRFVQAGGVFFGPFCGWESEV